MRDSLTLFPNVPETPKPTLVHILLVDDSAANRAIIKRFATNVLKKKHIRPEEIEFDQAINGINAVEMVAHRRAEKKPHYDVIVMDLNMGPTPEEGGLFAVEKIRQIEVDDKTSVKRTAHIIRYSTEKPDPTEDELALQGFDAMLNKVKTTEAEVSAALEVALANHPAMKRHEEHHHPKHSN